MRINEFTTGITSIESMWTHLGCYCYSSCPMMILDRIKQMKENGVGGENLKKICEFIVSGIECNIYFLCGHKLNMHL